jgi:hypothetical protein
MLVVPRMHHMPFLSPQGRYAIATKAERQRIDRLNDLYYDRLEDKQFQRVRDEMLEAGYLEPDAE